MKTLTEFYRDYAAWLDAGTPDGTIFHNGSGLCANLHKWEAASGLRYGELAAQMCWQFKAAGLDWVVPFNSGDLKSYEREVRSKTCHLNPARVAWVRERAK